MRAIKGGSTDQSTYLRFLDETTGLPETGVTSATPGLSLSYRREGAGVATITLSDLGSIIAGHSDGGIIHVGAGYLRVDLPDDAVAGSNTGVMVFGSATGMVVVGAYHPLVAYDPQDTVRLGLTALPNAAADAAGGLVISDAGGLDIDTVAANVAAVLADTGTDGVVLANGAITDAKIASNAITDAKIATDVIAAIWAYATASATTSGSIGKLLVDEIGQIPSIQSTVNDASATTTSFIGASGLSSANDFYNGSVIAFRSGALAGIARQITDYVGATRTITVSPALPAAPANSVSFVILGRIN